MKPYTDIYLLFAGNLIFLLAAFFDVNRWAFAAAVVLQFLLAMPAVARLCWPETGPAADGRQARRQDTTV